MAVVLSPPPRPPAIVQRLASTAQARIGTRNTLYYRNGRIACAAFVSSTLVKAGALSRSAASPSAAVLGNRLITRGWKKQGPMSVDQAARRALPGDVLLFGPCTRHFRVRHVGIAIGRDRFVGTSSSRGRVLAWRISAWRSQRCVRILRHR